MRRTRCILIDSLVDFFDDVKHSEYDIQPYRIDSLLQLKCRPHVGFILIEHAETDQNLISEEPYNQRTEIYNLSIIISIELVLACHYLSNNPLKLPQHFIVHLYMCLAITCGLMRVHADEDIANYVDIVAEQHHRHLLDYEQVDALESRGTDVVVHYFCDVGHLLIDSVVDQTDLWGKGIVFEESRLETAALYQAISYQLDKSNVDCLGFDSLYQLTLADQMVILSEETVEANVEVEDVTAPLDLTQRLQPILTTFCDFEAGKVDIYLINQSLNELRQQRQSFLEIRNRNRYLLMRHMSRLDAERLTIITHQNVMQDVGLIGLIRGVVLLDYGEQDVVDLMEG